MAALTTVFTPPASCFNNQYTAFNGDQSILVKDTAIASTECYPTSFNSLFASSIPYSPGVCPAGYTRATSTAYGDDATAAICCPLSWTVYPSGLGCSSIITTSTVLSLPTGIVTADSGVELAMHAFYVAWASSDLESFTPASAPLLAAITPASLSSNPVTTATSTSPSSATASLTSFSRALSSITPSTSSGVSEASPETTKSSATSSTYSAASTSVSSPPDTTQPAQLEKEQGLSKGAQVGIGVGVGIVGLLIIAGALWLIRRRLRKRKEAPSELEAHDASMREEFVVGSAHKKHMSELSSEGGIVRSSPGITSISTPAELDSGPTWDPPRRAGT